MANTAKQNPVLSFLSSNQTKLDTVRVSAVARKVNRDDKTDNAKRYFALNAKDVNRVNGQIVSLASDLAKEVFELKGERFSQHLLLKAFANGVNLHGLKSIDKRFRSICLLLKVSGEGIERSEFVSALVNAVSVYVERHAKAVDAKLANLTGKAKDIYTGKEYENILALSFVEKAETANA